MKNKEFKATDVLWFNGDRHTDNLKEEGEILIPELSCTACTWSSYCKHKFIAGSNIAHVLITNLRTNMKYMLFILWVSETVPEW